MYRYIKFKGFLQKQFEEPYTKEYSTGAAVVYNAANEEFEALLALQEEGKEITVDEFLEIIRDSDQFKHEIAKIQALFVEKTEGLKEMMADKISFVSGYIDKQAEVYEYLYQFAKQGAYDEQANKAVIAANEAAKAKAAEYVFLLNEVRSKLQKMVEAGKDIDELLGKAKHIDKDTTPEQIKALLP
jgi:hypothetical protein